MIDATYALLQPPSEERVMNTDHPRVYWEQWYAPNERDILWTRSQVETKTIVN